ncbi:MAG: NUDIX domain-containing protein [Gemmatimonadota bacterium]
MTAPASRAGPPGPRIELSAGGVVVRVIGAEPHVLLIRDPYHKWGLPKGHLEADEGAAEAALREVREETGLESLVLGPELGEIDWTFGLRGNRVHKYCRFFLMTAPIGEPIPATSEGITACTWLPVREAARTVGYGNAREVVRRASRYLRLPEGPDQLPWIVDPEE